MKDTHIKDELRNIGVLELIEDESGIPYIYIGYTSGDNTVDQIKTLFIDEGIAFDIFYDCLSIGDKEKYTYHYRPETKDLCEQIKFCYPKANINDLSISVNNLRGIMKAYIGNHIAYYEAMKKILYKVHPIVPSLEEWTKHVEEK